MSTVDLIAKAIEEKKSLAFGYHGNDRVVSPYAYGLNGANEVTMMAYQTEGGSTSGVTRKLRYFTVADMLGTAVSESPWEAPAPETEAGFSKFLQIYARI